MGCVGQFVRFIVTRDLVHALLDFPGVHATDFWYGFICIYAKLEQKKSCASTVSDKAEITLVW